MELADWISICSESPFAAEILPKRRCSKAKDCWHQGAQKAIKHNQISLYCLRNKAILPHGFRPVKPSF
jgi:hypothetical protein